jgi:hypothetical protein
MKLLSLHADSRVFDEKDDSQFFLLLLELAHLRFVLEQDCHQLQQAQKENLLARLSIILG